MLDFVTEESALETRRRELLAMLHDGRRMAAALSERQIALGRKLEETVEGIERLQDQVNAITPATEIVIVPWAAPRHASPVLDVVSIREREPDAARRRPRPFKPVTYLKCVAGGHDFMNSRSIPGAITCRRCKIRRGPTS